jgi:hypothetical protein
MIDYETITETQVRQINIKLWGLAHIRYMKTTNGEGSKRPFYVETRKEFCKRYVIDYYNFLQKEKFEEAMDWLMGLARNPEKEKRKEIELAELQEKKVYCKAFVQRAKKELKINEIKMVNFAFHELPLPRRVMSLSKLSYEQLEELERKLFKEK